MKHLPLGILITLFALLGHCTPLQAQSSDGGTVNLVKGMDTDDCDTIRTFPWIEDFVATDSVSSYSTCWEINGYDHPDGTSLRVHESYCNPSSSYSFDTEDFMESSIQGGYMLTPPIAVPIDVEEDFSLIVEHDYGLMAVVESANDADTVYVSTYNSNWDLQRCLVSLAAYAGQTIRARLVNNFNGNPGSAVTHVMVGYDTVLIACLSGQEQTVTDSATLFVATLYRGSTRELQYNWSSNLGGSIVTNAVGDSAWITYGNDINGNYDIVTLNVSNAHCHEFNSVYALIHVINCAPQTTYPWQETFDDGLACWYRPRNNDWYVGSSDYEKAMCSYCPNDSLNRWVVSKAIVLPDDEELCFWLFWKAGCSSSNTVFPYSVLVSTSSDRTDTSAFILIYRDTMPLPFFGNSRQPFVARSVSLADYVGQTIYVAFRNESHFANENYNVFQALAIDNVEVRSAPQPVVMLTADATTHFIGDTVSFFATITEGSFSGLTCTWHSSLLDSTWQSESNARIEASVVYPVAGADTVTVTVSNIYGRNTTSQVISVINYPLPQVSLVVPNNVAMRETVVYSASLNRCWQRGLSIRWHSSLLNQWHEGGSQWAIVYPEVGTDTVTVIVSNVDGSAAASVVVDVIDCSPIASLPWTENFNTIPAVRYDAANGKLPNCWYSYWNGTNATYAPHVISSNGYPFIDVLPSPALLMMAGEIWDCDTVEQVTLPRFNRPLQELAIAFDYRFEDIDVGTLTVGYVDNNDTFVGIADMLPYAGDYPCYHRDTVFLNAITYSNASLALRWTSHGARHGLAIDNIEVFSINHASDTLWRVVAVTSNVEGICEPYGSGLHLNNSTVEIGYNILDTIAEGGYWRFQGWSDGGTGNPRQILVVSDTTIVSLFEWVPTQGISNVSTQTINIYPNPASGKVTVELVNTSVATVSLIDMNGRALSSYSFQSPVSSFDVSGLPSGIYFVKVASQTGIAISKLVVKH